MLFFGKITHNYTEFSAGGVFTEDGPSQIKSLTDSFCNMITLHAVRCVMESVLVEKTQSFC